MKKTVSKVLTFGLLTLALPLWSRLFPTVGAVVHVCLLMVGGWTVARLLNK